MAFSADELRVMRRALAQVLHPPNQALALAPNPPALPPGATDRKLARVPDRSGWIEDVQEVLRLAESIDEAVEEAGRMRAFALADLVRYRSALPGSAAGYLERLRESVADGYVPDAEDLSALRTLTALPCAPAERVRRLALRSRCGELAEAAVRRRLTAPPAPPRPSALPASARVADVRVAGLRAGSGAAALSAGSSGNVAEFARPARPQRLREQPRPFPIRPGGPAMDPYDSAPRSVDPRPGGPAPKDPAERGRPIPTPGDLWPRGVRRERGERGEEDELATGTG
ncbi:hypothetical protein ACEZCY_17015 [Streptacidiphilus sp. N1-12]|uniref:Uncharacterized protein n=2 Tax=Streptacidiphilus alkalitolerans TaxID=3342712 RepID=A0ABV6VA93_9ACTN